MSEPFVSSYDEVFVNAFDKGIKEMPTDLSKLVTTMLDKFHEEVLSSLLNSIVDDMKGNLDREIMDYAAKVASSMLANALAGDSKEIRNLFGFNEWYMKYLYAGSRPTQWALIDAIVERRPDIIVDERIRQRDAEIAELNRTVGQLRQRIDHMQEEVE